jgi:hypothetical protein
MAPAWAQQPDGEPRRPRRRLWHVLPLLAGMGLVYQALQATTLGPSKAVNVPLHAQETLVKCRSLHVTPGPPDNFHSRKVSDRFARGTKPVLLRDAKIWTVRNIIYLKSLRLIFCRSREVTTVLRSFMATSYSKEVSLRPWVASPRLSMVRTRSLKSLT